MYLTGIETIFNREERNADRVENVHGLAVFTQNVHPFGRITRATEVSQQEREMAHWFVLHNSPELDPYLEYVYVKYTY